ncbi:hypothetical protein GCM10023220_71260 [Streptomyces ziwulingensis]|uniref:Uncharacterized protein n=1 Tax=Streptomyces ziwulingensis TaxID=1045501 RepID=A0ABP9D9H7_9ACTN
MPGGPPAAVVSEAHTVTESSEPRQPGLVPSAVAVVRVREPRRQDARQEHRGGRRAPQHVRAPSGT